MNKVIKFFIVTIILVFIILCMILYYNHMNVSTMSYTDDDTKNPDNPSRGYYVQIDSADKDWLEKYYTEVRLCLLAYDLYEYRDGVIPEEKIRELEAFLEEAKRLDMKCIFRGAYGFDRAKINDADSLERIAEHVKQISPVLNRYKAQIYCVQAGFFGPWGEWHSSVWLQDEIEAEKNRNWLLEQLLSALDEEIVIDVRRPLFVRDALNTGLDQKRIGVHNDGLLGSDSDLGTYDDEQYDRVEELGWIHQNIQVVQNGGEMPATNSYTKGNNALREFKKLKLSYLNLKYNEEVYEQWKNEMIGNESAFSYISKRVGYRYYISKLQYPKEMRKGFFGLGQTIQVTLYNQGFATTPDGYAVEFILEDAQGNWHESEVLESISKADVDGTLHIKIKAKTLREWEVKKIGLRISEKTDQEKKSQNCVELVNGKIRYENGVNFFADIDEEGNIIPMEN